MDAPDLELRLPPATAARRLDLALAACLPHLSRALIARLLKSGAILVDGRQVKPSQRARGGERVEIELPEPEVLEARPEPIPLEVIYEDGDLIVLNKPPGLVVHPSAGHPGGTLVNALLAHCRDLSSINGVLRPGIVHRLDGDTSGAIVAAKNDLAHRALQEQFMARSVRKTYLALCHGWPPESSFASSGRIGRHPTRRVQMAVLKRPGEGREAFTEFEVLEKLEWRTGLTAGTRGRGGPRPVASLLARPRTGRTHQIRVHLAHCGYPILADALYGREEACPALGLSRHALHAWSLEFEHPRSGRRLRFLAPLAPDLAAALERLGGMAPRE